MDALKHISHSAPHVRVVSHPAATHPAGKPSWQMRSVVRFSLFDVVTG